jgi:hypothetical protein
MPEAKHEGGDPELHALFEQFDGRLVSPGGAASLLGVSRKTIYTLGQRDRIRVFQSSEKCSRLLDPGPRWVFIPLEDIARYAKEVGRPFPKGF